MSTLPEKHVQAAIAMLQPYLNLATKYGPTQVAGLKKKNSQSNFSIVHSSQISKFLFLHVPASWLVCYWQL